jgi:peroxiredoxin
MEKIYEGKDKRTFHFDRAKGLVIRAEIAREFGSHLNSKGTGTLELKAIDELGPAKLATFRDEMNQCFESIEAYRKLYRSVPRSGPAAETLLNKARTVLTDARARFTTPEAIAAIDVQLNNHNQFAKYQIDEAKKVAAVLGHPAPAWEIKDLNGRTHTLDQYRGKVLVLDFWYRGCGWCMRAMPQVKQLAAEFKGEPVAVIGMNTDHNEADAKFVVDKLGLDYTTLKIDHAVVAKYGVQGFPTMVIIDRQGNVHDLHVGYSPTLQREVGEIVRQLLAKR